MAEVILKYQIRDLHNVYLLKSSFRIQALVYIFVSHFNRVARDIW
jgi:hypothetical protein